MDSQFKLILTKAADLFEDRTKRPYDTLSHFTDLERQVNEAKSLTLAEKHTIHTIIGVMSMYHERDYNMGE